MPILFPGPLPAGALLGSGSGPLDRPAAASAPPPAPVRAKAADPAPPAPIWFTTACYETLHLSPAGRVLHWHARSDAGVDVAATASPLSFNKDGTALDPVSGHLLFQAQSHSGLAISGHLQAGKPFSVGLIYHSDAGADALSLLSLQAAGDADYAYVSAEQGFIRFARREGGPLLSAPDPRKCVLLVLAHDGRTVRLSVNRSTALTAPLALPAGGALSLMLGCRGLARPLYNKLGSFALSDVMIWPEDVLARDFARAPQEALALWQERSRDGSQG